MPVNEIKANLLDFSQQTIFSAVVSWHQEENLQGIIKEIIPIGNENPALDYLLPGFIDAHVHIESSMMLPGEFARLAVKHGTIAAISDPHEIANVMGIKGIEFMLANSEKTPFHVFLERLPVCLLHLLKQRVPVLLMKILIRCSQVEKLNIFQK